MVNEANQSKGYADPSLELGVRYTEGLARSHAPTGGGLAHSHAPHPIREDTNSCCRGLLRPVKHSREPYPLPASLERAQTHWHSLNMDFVTGRLAFLTLIAFLPSSLSTLALPVLLASVLTTTMPAWQKPQRLFELTLVPSVPQACSRLCADTLLKALHSASILYLFQALPL